MGLPYSSAETAAVWYGRVKGDVRQQKEFQQCKIISSIHGKVYMDDEGNVLYENLGSNKSKVRSCVDKSYTMIDVDEIAVLFPSELLQNLSKHPQGLTASIKLGFQTKRYLRKEYKLQDILDSIELTDEQEELEEQELAESVKKEIKERLEEYSHLRSAEQKKKLM